MNRLVCFLLRVLLGSVLFLSTMGWVIHWALTTAYLDINQYPGAWLMVAVSAFALSYLGPLGMVLSGDFVLRLLLEEAANAH